MLRKNDRGRGTGRGGLEGRGTGGRLHRSVDLVICFVFVYLCLYIQSASIAVGVVNEIY